MINKLTFKEVAETMRENNGRLTDDIEQRMRKEIAEIDKQHQNQIIKRRYNNAKT